MQNVPDLVARDTIAAVTNHSEARAKEIDMVFRGELQGAGKRYDEYTLHKR